MLELDSYYTPAEVADVVVGAALGEPKCCVDSSCGEGSLLNAAERAFGKIDCVGLDKDSSTIRKLRRARPEWILSVGDLLSESQSCRLLALAASPACDLLVLNPPFSMGRVKGVSVSFEGRDIRASVGMAHILKAIDCFSPGLGVVAVVPESLLFSDTDEAARAALAERFRLKVVEHLSCATFRGARARSSVVRLVPGCGSGQRRVRPLLVHRSDMPQIVRGGLPTFEAKRRSRGLPYVHSTDIGHLVQHQSTAKLSPVSPIARGHVSGPLILLPRVGVPTRQMLEPVLLRSTVQLSDCVIALRFRSMRAAAAVACELRRRWRDLCAMYRGTGARYITVDRLESWIVAGDL